MDKRLLMNDSSYDHDEIGNTPSIHKWFLENIRVPSLGSYLLSICPALMDEGATQPVPGQGSAGAGEERKEDAE